MFENVTEKIVSEMEKREIIQTESKSIYTYGINQICFMLLNTLTFLAIGLVFHMIPETIIFTAAYIPFRIYAGGFHSKTPVGCWIISGVMISSVLTFMKLVLVNENVFGIMILSAGAVLFFLIPVEDNNKPLDKMEIRVYRMKGTVVFGAEVIITLILKFFQWYDLAVCIEMAWITLSIMLIFGTIKNVLLSKKEKQQTYDNS